jgi:hypothetical protein
MSCCPHPFDTLRTGLTLSRRERGSKGLSQKERDQRALPEGGVKGAFQNAL